MKGQEKCRWNKICKNVKFSILLEKKKGRVFLNDMRMNAIDVQRDLDIVNISTGRASNLDGIKDDHLYRVLIVITPEICCAGLLPRDDVIGVGAVLSRFTRLIPGIAGFSDEAI